MDFTREREGGSRPIAESQICLRFQERKRKSVFERPVYRTIKWLIRPLGAEEQAFHLLCLSAVVGFGPVDLSTGLVAPTT